MADLGVVIVTHQSASHLDPCVASLRAHSGYEQLPVVVADSGSTDGVEEVAGELGLRFLPGTNRGFAAGVNRAMADPALGDVRWILLVNPDVRMMEGSLADLVERCDAFPRAAMATTRIVDEDGRLVPNLGRPVSLREWAPMPFTRSGGDWFQEVERYSSDGTAAWASGSFLLVRRDVFHALGGFDERFFLYSEEVDLCRRAREAGWQVRYLPYATAIHFLARRPPDPHRARLLAWARLAYLAKWHRGLERVLMRTLRVLYLVRRIVHFARMGIPWSDDWAELTGTLRFRPDLYRPDGSSTSSP